MKKKLEAELISIAHRILKLKNKSDVALLHQETQKLYEKLSVLRFVEENFGEVQPTIGKADIEQKLDEEYTLPDTAAASVKADANEPIEEAQPNFAEADNKDENREQQPGGEEEEKGEDSPAEVSQPESPEITEKPQEKPEIPADIPQQKPEIPADEPAKPEISESSPSESDDVEDVPPTPVQPETKQELEVAEAYNENPASGTVEANNDDPKDEPAKPELFVPAFELAFDPKTDDAVETAKELSPQFSFDDLLGKDYADPVFVKRDEEQSEKREFTNAFNSSTTFTPSERIENKSVSLNDRLSKGITIGLNDRIAFMKHLFGNSSEDYNRVLSQLLTFDSFEEARNFIDEMVKPDYNNWDGKDEYAQRFMEIVEKRFS